MEFHAGDRVRILRTQSRYYGEIGTVHNNHSGLVYVKLLDDSFMAFRHEDVSASCFEPEQKKHQPLLDAARYILSQRGDNLCWRDFYTHLGKAFEQVTGEKIEVDLSLPPPEVMHRNCHSFIQSLEDGSEYQCEPCACVSPGLGHTFGCKCGCFEGHVCPRPARWQKSEQPTLPTIVQQYII